MKSRNAVIIVLDGVGDLPTALDGKTPLQAANKPAFDRLAREGACGIMHVAGPGVPVESDVAHLVLFGYDANDDYPGRGPLEALGTGLDVHPGDVALRGDFATLGAGMAVRDRRAGRDVTGSAGIIAAINAISLKHHPDVTVRAAHSTEQRIVVLLQGPGLSPAISATDPGQDGSIVLDCKPLDGTPAAAKTAAIVNELSAALAGVLAGLPANEERRGKDIPPVTAILLRGAGTVKAVTPVNEKHGTTVAAIAGNGLVRGLCRYLGMTVVDVKGATGTTATDLDAKFSAALQAMNDHDVVFVHVKGTDTLGHDKDPAGKRDFIQRVDAAVGRFLERVDPSKTFTFVTGDHATPSTIGFHSGDPVPVVMHGPTVITDHVDRFDEASCAGGYLGTMEAKHFYRLVLNKLDKIKKFGA